jgi:hypothetical protein
MAINSTRLRFIKAKTAAELSAAVSALPTKVEIKGNPIYHGKFWFVWFVIPDSVNEFKNLEIG